jgi:hypothetical protein
MNIRLYTVSCLRNSERPQTNVRDIDPTPLEAIPASDTEQTNTTTVALVLKAEMWYYRTLQQSGNDLFSLTRSAVLWWQQSANAWDGVCTPSDPYISGMKLLRLLLQRLASMAFITCSK